MSEEKKLMTFEEAQIISDKALKNHLENYVVDEAKDAEIRKGIEDERKAKLAEKKRVTQYLLAKAIPLAEETGKEVNEVFYELLEAREFEDECNELMKKADWDGYPITKEQAISIVIKSRATEEQRQKLITEAKAKGECPKRAFFSTDPELLAWYDATLKEEGQE